MTLSICMIVKNESDVLARCLEGAAAVADELIVVDTGSTDETRDIALRFTPNVYDFPWCDDFAAARNFSFSKATMDYTMWLDADDVIGEEDRALLLALKEELSPAVDMVYLRYDVAFDAGDRPTLSYYRERIVKTSMGFRWVGAIHEVIPQRGTAEYREIRIQHRKLHPAEPGRNLRIFETLIGRGQRLDPRQTYYYARELMYNGRYAEAVGRFLDFLDGGGGWVENEISACKDLAYCYTRLGDGAAALQSLLRSFTYDAPRAELCCELGGYFMDRGEYRTAAFWYETAAGRPMEEQNGGFCLADCYGYIPYMQLCVLYDRLGERRKAVEYNEKAGRIKPDDPGYLYNRDYFGREEGPGADP